MRAVIVRSQAIRRVGLLIVGALLVHWTRYLIAYGTGATAELEHRGHGSLTEFLPTLMVLGVSVIASATVFRVAAGGGGKSRALGGQTLIFALALLGIYSGQELTEGVLASGHPGGFDALLADIGWIAAPLSLATGLFLSLAERLILATEDRFISLLGGRRTPRVSDDVPFPVGAAALVPDAADPLAFGLARRPPPLLG